MSNPTDILNRLFKETKPQDRLYPKPETGIQDSDSEDILNTNIYNVMLNRRSQRKFEIKDVEDWKLDIIFALQILLLLQEDFKDLIFFILKIMI